MTMTDWNNLTNYMDTVGVTPKTFSFNKTQNFVRVTTRGNANVTYTIGSQSGTLTPGQSVSVAELITSFTLTAVSGSQTIEVWSTEYGTEKVEDNGISLDDITASLADMAKHKGNWINVLQNGLTVGVDCTTTLSTLMSANGGAVYFFPRGDYLFSGTLPYLVSNTSLIGEPGTRFIISNSYTNDGLNCLFRNPQYNNNSASVVSNIIVKDIEFRNDVQSTIVDAPIFLGLWATQNFLIDNCKFINPYTLYSGNNIDIRGGCSYGVVRGCFFENLGEINANSITGGGVMVRNYHTSLDNHHLYFQHNTFHKVGSDEIFAIFLSDSISNTTLNRDIIVSNNTFICDNGTTASNTTKYPDVLITVGNGGGGGNRNKNIVFANNEIICYSVNQSVIRAYGENINIFNNSVTYSNGNGTSDRIVEVLTGSGKVNVKGNTFYSTGAKYGISTGNGEIVIQNNTIYFTGTASSSVIFGSATNETVLNNYINANTATDICENIMRVIENTIIMSGVTNVVQNVRALIGNYITCATNPTYIYANYQATIDQVVIKKNVVKGVTANAGIRCNTNALQRISICDNEFDYSSFTIGSMTLAVVINNILFNTTLNSGNITTQIVATTLVFKNNLAGASYLSV